MHDNLTLAELELLERLNKERTQGEWFWSNRTLRSEIHEDDGIEEGPAILTDILNVDLDRCIYGKSVNMNFIPAATNLIDKLIAAARRGMETKSGKIYQHYKGGLYELICYASYENGEAAGVVYRSLDTGIVWIRPQEEFAAKFKPAPPSNEAEKE